MEIGVANRKISEAKKHCFSNRQIFGIEEHYTFVKKRIESLQDGVSNCLGTGLFVGGEIDRDMYLWGNEPNKILNGLEEARYLAKGMFVAWEHNDLDGGLHYYHLGIIIRTNPIIIVHRNGFLGSVEREFLNGIDFDNDARLKYLIPKRLEALL